MAPVEINALEGYWGEPTSTLEWCEENYVVSYHIAEFWNTFSSFAFIIPPLMGIIFALEDMLERRVIYSFCGMIMVGISSSFFHMTLRHDTQMWDELSMVWSSTFFVYSVFECNSPPKSSNVPLALGLVAYSGSISVSYLILQKPIFHQLAFGIITVLILGRAFYCANRMHHSKFLLWYPLCLYVLALVLWSIDNEYCDTVRWVRSYLPFPLSGLFQFHAWWHILTALASLGQCLYSCHLRTSYLKQDNKLTFWFKVIPFVRIKKGVENGHLHSS